LRLLGSSTLFEALKEEKGGKKKMEGGERRGGRCSKPAMREKVFLMANFLENESEITSEVGKGEQGERRGL